MHLIDFFDILNDLAAIQDNAQATKSHAGCKLISTYGYVPRIQRVTFNGNKTIVWFVDNSKCIVECSKDDKYDRKTAIAYAICKRLFGKVKPDMTVDGHGFGTYLQKVVDSGFDQQLEEKLAAEKKRQAKEAHLARQKAQHDAAFEKRVQERAKQILLERAAIDRANALEDAKRCKDSGNACSCHSKILNEHASTPNDSQKPYQKPNKHFRDFTQQEKREYWRAHNAMGKASKKHS